MYVHNVIKYFLHNTDMKGGGWSTCSSFICSNPVEILFAEFALPFSNSYLYVAKFEFSSEYIWVLKGRKKQGGKKEIFCKKIVYLFLIVEELMAKFFESSRNCDKIFKRGASFELWIEKNPKYVWEFLKFEKLLQMFLLNISCLEYFIYKVFPRKILSRYFQFQNYTNCGQNFAKIFNDSQKIFFNLFNKIL